jgi:hypothetical protein
MSPALHQVNDGRRKYMSCTDVDLQCRLLWIMTYAAVIASEKESVETSVIQANAAVWRFRAAWGIPSYVEGPVPGSQGGF